MFPCFFLKHGHLRGYDLVKNKSINLAPKAIPEMRSFDQAQAWPCAPVCVGLVPAVMLLCFICLKNKLTKKQQLWVG